MENNSSPQQTFGASPPPSSTMTTWAPSSSWSWPGPDPAAMGGPPMSGPPPTWPPPIQASSFTSQVPPHAPQPPPPVPQRTAEAPRTTAFIPPRPTQPAPVIIQPSTATTTPSQPPPAAVPSPVAPPSGPTSVPTRATPAQAATHPAAPARKGAGKKRKRGGKPKEERRNRKNWAEGVREEFMKPYVPRYVDAVAKGGWPAGQAVIRELCAEYHAKIPWTLPYTKEPTTPLPEYDPTNPPVLEPLSDEEEAERSAVLTELNGMLHRWVHWRAKKVPGYRQQYRANRNNPFDRLVLHLCGMSPKGAKKALQPVQQYAHEHPDASVAAGTAFEDEMASKGFVKNGDKIIMKQTVNWTMGWIKKNYFDKLPASERSGYGVRARQTARAEKEAWEKALKEPPKRDAKSIQKAWDCLDAFVEPLLRGIVSRMDANVVLLVGARLPEEGGKPKARHFSMGKNLEGLPFSLWDESNYQKNVLGSWLDYIETIWSPEECAAVDLDAPDVLTPGSIGRTEFTAQEMDDDDESDGEEEEDKDDDEDEVPLADTTRGGARKRQKKNTTSSSKDTSSLDPNLASASQQPARLPLERSRLDPQLIQQLSPDRQLTPERVEQLCPERVEQFTPEPVEQIESRRIEQVDPLLIDPQLIGQVNPQPIEPEQPQASRRQSARTSALQRQREQARSSSLAMPRSEPAQRAGVAASVEGLDLRNASSASQGSPTIPASRSRASLQPPPHAPRAPSPVAPTTVGSAVQLPQSAHENEAAAWFRDAWQYIAHDFGPDWGALLRAYSSWEEAHAYSNAKGVAKALPTLNTRPKEVGVWVSHARWSRGVSGEPNPKDFAFAQSLLRRWWEWYRRLSPSWRSTRADGTLEPCTVSESDMGKLECSGINGVLNLVVVLKRHARHSDVLVPVAQRRRVHEGDDVEEWQPTIAPSRSDPLEEYIPFFMMGEGVSCEDQVIEVTDVSTGKRKRYASCWRPHDQMFLHELLRHEGLAGDHHNLKCASCKVPPSSDTTFYKCADCGRWTGDFWDKLISLKDLGLIYQIGHGGLPCPAPQPTIYSMTVIAPTHICRVNVRYCACSRGERANHVQQLLREGWYPATVIEPSTCALFTTLDHFMLLTAIANTNVRDFITSLQTSGNALRLLPLANRFRKNARSDAALGGGFGSFVEPQQFKEHLKGYVNEEDVSTCISFAALMEKDTKLTTGCRVSGCGACSCTRHETIRPNGLGDLQKGERYANMDYIFWSSLQGEGVSRVMLTYDIGCQWKKGLLSRVQKLPKSIQPTFSNQQPVFEVDVRLPVWHGNVHDIACRSANSVRYARGAGKPDGEGPERIWSQMNSMASATKEMGEGVRDGVIEHWTAHLNIQKNVGQGHALEIRLKLAMMQQEQRRAELLDIEQALEPRVLKAWQKMYDEYERDDVNKPNPFMPQVSEGPSEHSVRAQLVRDEAEDVKLGRTPMRATTKAAFVVLGLQLEEMQQRIASMAADISLAALDRDRKVQEQRIAWFKKLTRYRALQDHFMPVAVAKALADEQARNPDIPPPDAEHVKIWLPSHLTREEREEGCVEGLAGVEVSLRVAQCTDALKDIRYRLHARRYIINERNAHVTGQQQSTRARNVIARLDERILRLAEKYRAARRGLFCLAPAANYPAFQELKDNDLTIDDDREADGASTERLNNHGERGSRAISNARKSDSTPLTARDRAIASVREADSRRNLTSWIWTAFGGPSQDGEAQVHDAVRVEWAKARARSERWTEEVNIVTEEMRRVLRSLRWYRHHWEDLARFEAELDPAGRAGLRAYALRQAHLFGRLRTSFHVAWSAGSGKAASHGQKPFGSCHW
ncbi:hypothetical protein GGG16DRAFT_28990, partial [Schizophyllum commune]